VNYISCCLIFVFAISGVKHTRKARKYALFSFFAPVQILKNPPKNGGVISSACGFAPNTSNTPKSVFLCKKKCEPESELTFLSLISHYAISILLSIPSKNCLMSKANSTLSSYPLKTSIYYTFTSLSILLPVRERLSLQRDRRG
jgi:hypothetical protein